MEDKLLELKEEFCKWYCPGRNTKINISYVCSIPQEDRDSEDRECKEDCALDSITPCEHCQVSEYIRFIRDELN